MIRIAPQIFRTHNGLRLITHAVFYGETFICFSFCFCGAMKAANQIK